MTTADLENLWMTLLSSCRKTGSSVSLLESSIKKEHLPFFMIAESVGFYGDDGRLYAEGPIITGTLTNNDSIFYIPFDNIQFADVKGFEIEGIDSGDMLLPCADAYDKVTLVVSPREKNEDFNWGIDYVIFKEQDIEIEDVKIDKTNLKKAIRKNFGFEIPDIKTNLKDTSFADVFYTLAGAYVSHDFKEANQETETSQRQSSSKTKANPNMSESAIDKSKVEYVVGIDLGHGETSAALCPLQWEEPEANWADPTDIEMESNRKVLASAITILPDGKAFIGEKAFNPDILKKADVHVCFKQRPVDISGEAEQLMIRYMSEVYKLILENTNGILTKDHHVVYIATPSGWDNNAKNLYFMMAKEAGMPIAGVTKESRAAFVKGMKDPITGLSRNARKGAIVFDMGSSTLDFTYLSDNNAPIDYGYDCGASKIEKILYAKKKAEGKVEQFEEKYPALIDCLLFAARTVKEEVYFKKGQKVRKTIHLDELVEDDDLDETVKFVFEPGQLNELLIKDGYVGTIENAMHDFVADHINNAPIYGVFLTGGASGMDFIEELVMKCFGVEKHQISHDQDPSLTISQGVAEVARMDLHTAGADEDLSEVIDEIINNNSVYDAFVESFSFDLYDSLTDEMAALAHGFKDSESDFSLNDLSEAFELQVEESVQEFLPKASDYVSAALEEQTKDLVERIESMVAVYTQQGVEVKMPELDVNIDINLQPSAIRRIVDSISHELAKSIKNNVRTWLTGAGAIFGLLGMAAGWLIGSLFNDSEEEKLEKAMNKKLDREKRAEVYDSLSEEWEEITGEIREEIYNAVAGNKQIKNNITKAVSVLLNQYKHELEQARMLID